MDLRSLHDLKWAFVLGSKNLAVFLQQKVLEVRFALQISWEYVLL